VPGAASSFLARNISALLLHLVTDGALAIDPSDEIQAGVVITHDGAVIQPATAALLAEASPSAASPGAASPSAASPGAASSRADTSGGTTP
jgi:NAD(P) transhydrogenase subunit alpha